MGIDLPEDRMPDELLLDDIPPDHITYSNHTDLFEHRQTESRIS